MICLRCKTVLLVNYKGKFVPMPWWMVFLAKIGYYRFSPYCALCLQTRNIFKI